MNNKKAKIGPNVFAGIVNESKCKANKSCVNQGREFYNKSMQGWFDDNDILMYWTHNEDRSVVVQRFINTLKG